METHLKKTEFMGVNISVVGIQELLDFIIGRALARKVALINNVNIQAMNLAESNAEFRNILNQSDAVFCDGFGVKLGASLLGVTLGERMTPPDWIDRLFEGCVKHSLSVYALGDTIEEVTAFVRKVNEKFPSLRVAGYHHGFFDMHGGENGKILGEIRSADADIVLVGMGMPRQEEWAFRAREELSKGVLIATGALYRWYTGSQKRSPKWMTDHGLEWLGRLLLEPRRMWRRYVIGNPAFFWRVLVRKMCAKPG
jgi:N-acetylglucosaminyldiphosphoundecaprenol N-acetyl-beta-D-mannosaminyltransferase